MLYTKMKTGIFCLVLVSAIALATAEKRLYRPAPVEDVKGVVYKGQQQEEVIVEPTPPPPPLPSNCQDCFYWTRWVSTDNPEGNGDYETLGPPDRRGKSGSVHSAHPNFCQVPVRMECRESSSKQPWYTTNDVISTPCLPFQHKGFVCENRRQEHGRQCHDYEVRLLCFKECACLRWSDWTDTDHPREGEGDLEIIGLNRFPTSSNPCFHHMPVDVECETINGGDIYRTGDKNLICDQRGFACYNKFQTNRNRRCSKNYRVRFLCPQFNFERPI